MYFFTFRTKKRVGIIPDIYVWPSVKGIRDGRDEILEKALEWLAE